MLEAFPEHLIGARGLEMRSHHRHGVLELDAACLVLIGFLDHLCHLCGAEIVAHELQYAIQFETQHREFVGLYLIVTLGKQLKSTLNIGNLSFALRSQRRHRRHCGV